MSGHLADGAPLYRSLPDTDPAWQNPRDYVRDVLDLPEARVALFDLDEEAARDNESGRRGLAFRERNAQPSTPNTREARHDGRRRRRLDSLLAPSWRFLGEMFVAAGIAAPDQPAVAAHRVCDDLRPVPGTPFTPPADPARLLAICSQRLAGTALAPADQKYLRRALERMDQPVQLERRVAEGAGIGVGSYAPCSATSLSVGSTCITAPASGHPHFNQFVVAITDRDGHREAITEYRPIRLGPTGDD